MKRSVKSTQRLPRLLAFKVTGTGTAAIGEGSTDAVLTDNGTGDYTITFNTAFARAPICAGNSTTANIHCEISSSSTTAVRVLTRATSTNTLTDAVFHLLVVGFDAADAI